MQKLLQILLSVALAAGTLSCGKQDGSIFTGTVYPPTTEITTVFQPAQVPAPCRVFAEALVFVPPELTGKEVSNIILAEARARGADVVLVGQTRESRKDEGTQFIYFGPAREYRSADQWRGWRYGYALWSKQGEWVPVGYREWGNEAVFFEIPLLMQVALLRCQ
ncbi:hypothetical protein [Desulfobulbus alkaliphilus]|uniref:hypothetical protein n=1 Tax=Desulfobulbus alkaliphilus TaxID=869814 RepID=UPI001965B1B1|nr:hypothetical protein [Desulfobulbus alkaliphilus]MBM9538299.1 hypothetical protein [Desulfobulbus alkaliphilus]